MDSVIHAVAQPQTGSHAGLSVGHVAVWLSFQNVIHARLAWRMVARLVGMEMGRLVDGLATWWSC